MATPESYDIDSKTVQTDKAEFPTQGLSHGKKEQHALETPVHHENRENASPHSKRTLPSYMRDSDSNDEVDPDVLDPTKTAQQNPYFPKALTSSQKMEPRTLSPKFSKYDTRSPVNYEVDRWSVSARWASHSLPVSPESSSSATPGQSPGRKSNSSAPNLARLRHEMPGPVFKLLMPDNRHTFPPGRGRKIGTNLVPQFFRRPKTSPEPDLATLHDKGDASEPGWSKHSAGRCEVTEQTCQLQLMDPGLGSTDDTRLEDQHDRVRIRAPTIRSISAESAPARQRSSQSRNLEDWDKRDIQLDPHFQQAKAVAREISMRRPLHSRAVSDIGDMVFRRRLSGQGELMADTDFLHEIPDHLTGSPLCPANPKNRKEHRGYCPVHSGDAESLVG